MTRIFQATSLKSHSTITLDDAASHHLARVLRASIGDPIVVFNGEGGEYPGIIRDITKKTVAVDLHEFNSREAESPLNLYLAQGISRGEKMDYTIQKAVELGVKKIFPLLTERCNVKLDEERREKRLQHWRSIVISACEQSGRNHIPEVIAPQSFQHFIQHTQADWKFILAPTAEKKLSILPIQRNASVILSIGPEGGFSDNEIHSALKHDFTALNLGPRILRTETAAVAALSAIQLHAGDFSE